MMAASLYQLLNEANESHNVDDSCQKPSFHEFKQQKNGRTASVPFLDSSTGAGVGCTPVCAIYP